MADFTFRDALKLWRAPRSLSQAAREIGCTKAHLWELEAGRATNPTIKTLAGIARAYGASVPYLAHLAARALPAISGAADGVGRDPRPTGQLRDVPNPHPEDAGTSGKRGG